MNPRWVDVGQMEGATVNFSEFGRPWEPLPSWVTFFVQAGFAWPRFESQTRRVALISTPCDSAAAGLICLGAMIRDLGESTANNVDQHYERLLRFAAEYLGNQSSREGGKAEISGRLRRIGLRGVVEISEQTDVVRRKLVLRHRKGMLESPNPDYATRWYIDGEPPPVIQNGLGSISPEPYQAIIPNAPILPENLTRAYAGLCLVARAAGERATRELYAGVRFRHNGGEHALSDLLTIYGWSSSQLSRLSFFNTRTGQMDRHAQSPSLAVIDGDSAFLRVIGDPRFRSADAIAVVNRGSERESLEAVGNKLLEMRQWYVPDDLAINAPPGTRISVALLKRR